MALLVYARTKISDLRNTAATYKDRLLSFANFTFLAWVISALQDVILLPAPFKYFPEGSFLNNSGLWLGLLQNALWVSAVLSLYPKRLSLPLRSLPVLFPIVIAAVTSRIAILRSETTANIDSAVTLITFTAFVLWILRWRHRNLLAAMFFVHGCTQLIWRSLWFTPVVYSVLAFTVWRSLILLAWIDVISTMVARSEASLKDVVSRIERLKLANPLDVFAVMISSTRKDLERERDAADGALKALRLTRYRAEMLGTVPLSPRDWCELMAVQCDILVLIIGERYGHVLEPEGISVVEFEYNAARGADRDKILVYIQEGVRRTDTRQMKFLERVQEFNDGHVTSTFTTPEDLSEQIPRDVQRWLTSNAKLNRLKTEKQMD